MTLDERAAPRSLANQSVAELGGRFSVLHRQRADHEQLDALLDELDRAAPEQQDRVLRRIYRLVFPHAFAEESVLWPVLRRSLLDGPALTLRIEQEHQEVNELATALERLDPHDPRRTATLDRLVTVLREDVRDEEDALLPQLQELSTTARLRRLGLAWELVRRVAPTRPHPVVARRPPGNVVAALPLSVVDRARDGLDVVLQHAPASRASAVRRLSRRLTVLAHRLEDPTPMRVGEDPSTAR